MDRNYQQRVAGIDMSSTTLHAQRQHIPYLEDLVNVDDDWRGVGDAAARRKRQNRLNVRAYRRRKRMASSHDSRAVQYASVAAQPSLLHWIERRQAAIFLPKREEQPDQSVLPMDMPASTSIISAVFPLSPDHLITLVQFNALRGSLANRQLLDAALSVDACTTPSVEPTGLHMLPKLTSNALEILPQSLHPTETQRIINHPHWVDIVPHPRIRDNLINAIGNFDEHLLWFEIVGGLFFGFTSKSSQITHGVIMWDTPWYWGGWELGESFVRKWAWALKGCEDVLLATNYWREKRGEKRLVIKL